MTQTETINIEVYCADSNGRDLFGVLSALTPDLPEDFYEPLQEWVQENYAHLEIGESVEEAGVLEYEPNGEVVDIHND